MSFLHFATAFGMLYDQKLGKFTKWNLWPKQEEACNEMNLYKILWLVKARQLGISELASLYGDFVGIKEPRSEIDVISKKRDDAKYFIKRRALTKLEAMKNLEMSPGVKLPWPEYIHQLSGKIEWENGSYMEAFPSTDEEVRSHTPRLVIFDEIRSFERKDAYELWSSIIPAILEQPYSQAICVSTTLPGSWFNEMTRKIMAGKEKHTRLFFMPANSKPERTEEWYAEQESILFDKKLFQREYPRTIEEALSAREGLVYNAFDEERHCRRIEPNFYHRYIVCYDHGKQHPAVMLFTLYDKHDDHLYVFDEVFLTGKQLPEVAYTIRKKMNFYKDTWNAPRPQLAIADTACFAQDGRKPVVETLKSIIGLNFVKSKKHDKDGSIELLRARFHYGGITIDPKNCPQTIRQILNLRWKYDYDPDAEVHDEKPEKPIDIDNDTTDCLEYITAELHAKPRYDTPVDEKELYYGEFSRKQNKKTVIYDPYGNEYGADFYGPSRQYTKDELEAWQAL